MSTPLTLLAATLVLITARPGIAEVQRPWCADYGGSVNCGFHSYEQCKMTASGTNTWCVQNQWYLQYGPGQQGPQTTGRSRRQ
jgi:hypothetical protein